MEISNRPDEEIKVIMVIKMLTREKNERTQGELQQRERKYMKVPNKNHELKNKITELPTHEGFNSRLDEEQSTNLADTGEDSPRQGNKKEKEF